MKNNIIKISLFLAIATVAVSCGRTFEEINTDNSRITNPVSGSLLAPIQLEMASYGYNRADDFTFDIMQVALPFPNEGNTVSRYYMTESTGNGFWKTNPETTENSVKSLDNAMDLRVYGSEFDVRMSKDGKLVVNHDEHHGTMEISETDFSELKKLRLSNGEKIPTLKKYLKYGRKDNDIKLIVELKPAKSKELEDEMVEKSMKLIERLRLENQCEFISFSLNICKEIKRRKPEAIVQYLNGDLSPKQLRELKIDGLDYHYKILTEKHPEWIGEANKLGLITNTWTVNDTEIFRKLKTMGIGFITTNVPDEFLIINNEK